MGNELGRLFADQGAEVIKIENRAFPDAARVALGGEMCPAFAAGQPKQEELRRQPPDPAGVGIPDAPRACVGCRRRELPAWDVWEIGLGLGFDDLREVNPAW